jgi:signal transduction histidine kinase
MIFAWGIFDQHMFDLVPVARDTFVRSMGHGLLVLDDEGNLADINPAAMRMLDVPAKPARLSAEAALGQWPYLEDCWRGPAETTAELRLDGPQGLRWVDARTSFLYDGKDAYQGRVIALWDTTARKRAEEEMKEAKSRAEMYLDLMSHDILNMNMVGKGFIEQTLAVPVDDGKRWEYLQRSLRSLDKSTRLIENVEKMQQARSGEHKLGEVDASHVLLQALMHYSGMPGVKAAVHYDIPADCKVVANDLLYDVFINLVGNAVKHGGPETVLNVRIGRTVEQSQAYYRFTFEDNGPGIPDDMKEDIFGRLQRGNTTTGGKGLGLYLVRTLVETYQGRVWVEDRVAGDHSKGARFVVLLPAVEK